MSKEKVYKIDTSEYSKMEIESHNRTMTLFFILCVIGLAILAVSVSNRYQSQPVKFNLDCSTDIQYKNVGHNLCWGGFASQWCPMPTKLNCKIAGEMPAYEFDKIKEELMGD